MTSATAGEARASSTHPALDADPELLAFAASVDRKVDELEGEASGRHEQQGQGVAGGAPAPIPLEREIEGTFMLVAGAIGKFLPSVKVVLDQESCEELGKVLAPIARKYGLERHVAGFRWREEIQALIVVVPIAIGVKAAIAHDLAQYRAQAKASAGAQPGADLGGQDPAAQASPASSPAPAAQPLKPIEKGQP